ASSQPLDDLPTQVTTTGPLDFVELDTNELKSLPADPTRPSSTPSLPFDHQRLDKKISQSITCPNSQNARPSFQPSFADNTFSIHDNTFPTNTLSKTTSPPHDLNNHPSQPSKRYTPGTSHTPLDHVLPKNLEDKVLIKQGGIDSGLNTIKPIRTVKEPFWKKDFV
ncbi:hypothetical protein A2U01_0038873, partial [Trifolium medium]|nr:hypothetical protein [Trifolium medium]